MKWRELKARSLKGIIVRQRSENTAAACIIDYNKEHEEEQHHEIKYALATAAGNGSQQIAVQSSVTRGNLK